MSMYVILMITIAMRVTVKCVSLRNEVRKVRTECLCWSMLLVWRTKHLNYGNCNRNLGISPGILRHRISQYLAMWINAKLKC
jgi:hypothetical protein